MSFKDKVEDIYPLNSLQEGILYHYLKDNEGDIYFEQLVLYIEGKVDLDIFKKAWQVVINSNEVLRSIFRWEKISQPVQIILKESNVNITFHDFTKYNGEFFINKLNQLKSDEKADNFDLRKTPFRLNLIKKSTDRYVIIINNHPILYDGWSNAIILKEFVDTYNLLSKNENIESKQKIKLKKYYNQLKQLNTKHENVYWKNYLSDYKNTELPVKANIDNDSQNKNEKYILRIPESKKGVLDEFLKSNRITYATLFYATWGVVLNKYCQSDDVLFGITVSGRSLNMKGISDIIGLLINTQPYRVKFESGCTIIDLLQNISNSFAERENYQHMSLSQIRQLAGVSSLKNMFDSIIVVENYPIDIKGIAGNSEFAISGFEFDQSNNFDLTLSITTFDDIEVTFVYNGNIIDKKCIEKLSQYFEKVLFEICNSSNEKLIDDIELLTEEDKNEIVYNFNHTKESYRKEDTIIDRFERQVLETPDRIAVLNDKNQLTYAELNKLANRVAGSLSRLGVKENDLVCLFCDRSIELVISIFGILKIGAVYVPIEIDNPKKRIEKILSRVNPTMILIDNIQDKYYEKICQSTEKIYNINNLMQEDVKPVYTIHKNSEDVAYVIHTSGSTGEPKGVVVRHRPVINIIEWINKSFDVNEIDRFLCIASYNFDLSVYDFFGVLSSGGSIYLASKDTIQSPILLLKTIFKQGISAWNSAPAALQQLTFFFEQADFSNQKNNLRLVLLSGDWIPLGLPVELKKYFPNTETISLGGATEATIWSNYFRINEVNKKWVSIPYGKPTQNAKYYILDRNKMVSPINVPGNLYIGGECLADGYLNNIEQTSKQFIENPFCKGEIIYDTGDLARWCWDGNIEFLGRTDNQVKIRGYRIELGEIKAALCENDLVKDCIITVLGETSEQKVICAYYLSDQELTSKSLEGYLAMNLPQYMLPAYFIKIDEIPLTLNGKINFKALPKPELETNGIRNEPRDNIEIKLSSIWLEILGINGEYIDIETSFFELGGNSLSVVKMSSLIHKNFEVKIPLTEIFRISSIKGIADFIRNYNTTKPETLKFAELKEYYPLSMAQRRPYIMQKFNPESTIYNVLYTIIISPNITINQLESAVNELISRNDVLRASFDVVDNNPVQKFNKTLKISILEQNYTNLDINDIISSFNQPFSFKNPPLFRVGLIRNYHGKNLFIFNFHHTITDAVSLTVLENELVSLINQKELARKKYQFKDFTVWQDSEEYKERVKTQNKFWSAVFSKPIITSNTMFDYERSSEVDYIGERICFEIDEANVNNIKNLSKELSLTPYMTVFTIVNILFSKILDSEDIIIGTLTDGRGTVELESIMGMFVNTLPVRNSTQSDKSFLELLNEVNNNVREVFKHQDFQLEELIEELGIEREKARNPLFDVVFEWQNLDNYSNENISTLREFYELDNTTKFDLIFTGVEHEDTIRFEVKYKLSLFKKETVESYINYFKLILSECLNDTKIKLGDIRCFDEVEGENSFKDKSQIHEMSDMNSNENQEVFDADFNIS